MPIGKEFKNIIPVIYKRSAENLGLFFFIKAQLQLFPTLTIKEAIRNYRKFTNLTIDDWDDESMQVTYCRMQKEYYDDLKNECTKENKRTAGS